MWRKLSTERYILRRIFGPTKNRVDISRIKTNDELNNLVRNKNIINYIKIQRISWFSHVHRITDDRMVKKLCEWIPISTRFAGRPNIRWENDKKEDLRFVKINNWTKCFQDRLNGNS